MNFLEQDRELAQRMLGGDERAFDEFFEGHFPGLYRFALARLHGDTAAAEDVAQAALCKAIGKLATYRGEAALSTWLCTFCRHEISALFIREGRAAHPVVLAEDSREARVALESLSLGDRDGPEAAFGREELGRRVQVVLDRLPGHYANALEWKYLEDLPVKDVAERLGVTAKAAESLLVRARDAFRDGFAALDRGPWEWS